MKAEDYLRLILTYLNGELSADQFVKKFNSVFLNEPEGMNDDLFIILEDLFEDGEAYSPMWKPEDENPYRIIEKTFREEVLTAQKELEKYLEMNV